MLNKLSFKDGVSNPFFLSSTFSFSCSFLYDASTLLTFQGDQQTTQTQDELKHLVRNGQFEFINGGWCMHDEAATHYVAMVDQTTLGHRKLFKQFGVVPKVGWQIGNIFFLVFLLDFLLCFAGSFLFCLISS